MARSAVLLLFCAGFLIACARNTTPSSVSYRQIEPSHRTNATYLGSRLSSKNPNFRATPGSGRGALVQTAALLPHAICASIDAANDAKQRKALCNDLLRSLSETDAPAYEWQNYHVRCN